MFRKITLVVGFAAGYVLGAKAGTERYEQIQGQARALLQQTARPKGSGAAPGSAGPSASGGPVTEAPGRPGGSTAEVGPVTSSVPGDSSTSVPTPVKSIDEMTELELELATAPLLPGGTSGGAQSGAAGAAGTAAAEPRSTTARGRGRGTAR